MNRSRDSPDKNAEVGCHAPPSGDLPYLGSEPVSPALQADSLPADWPEKPNQLVLIWSIDISVDTSIFYQTQATDHLKLLSTKGYKDLPGGPVVCLPMQWMLLWPLVVELRSHMPQELLTPLTPAREKPMSTAKSLHTTARDPTCLSERPPMPQPRPSTAKSEAGEYIFKKKLQNHATPFDSYCRVEISPILLYISVSFSHC